MERLKQRLLSALFSTVLLLFLATNTQAGWIENGASLCTATGEQSAQFIISDGAGGAIAAWCDDRSGTGYDIYAQRIDAAGTVLWAFDGVALCTAAGEQYHINMISYGAGGAILAWDDARGGAKDIYAQRIDASGTAQWTAGGVALCTAAGDQHYPALASDGAGGVIVTWADMRGGVYDIYAQRIDASGTAQWTADGVPICTAAGSQHEPSIVSDGAGGAIATWHDRRSGNYDIYAQRVDASGAVQWAADGVALSTAFNSQWRVRTVSDQAGGVIAVWHDNRGGTSYDIYAQRVDASGAVQWTVNGVALCTASSEQWWPRITSDSLGGAIVTWMDRRSGEYDIYVQRVDASGAAQWTAGGVALCTASGIQQYPDIASDGESGAVVAWQDILNGFYAQRVDSTGTARWVENGVTLCTFAGPQQRPAIVADGAGGAIVSWWDSRNGSDDIYAQKVYSTGACGYEIPPYIRRVSDVPNDQGGKIEIRWDRCFILEDPDPTITYYSVWRRLPRASSALATEVFGVKDVSIDFSGLAHRMLESSSDYAWEWLANIPARLTDTYCRTLESRYDSTGSDTGWQHFIVTGHTDDPFVYYDSPPDSGYSVDNLAPCAPSGLEAEYMGDFQLFIHWNPNMEADLSHYAVYRGTVPDFVPDETSRIGTTTDSSFVDENFGYDEYYYKISAIDIHENESSFSLLTPDMISGAPRGDPRYGNVLFQNAPNPFLSSTRITFSLKKEDYVRLSIFDARGRLVRTLVNEVRGANRYVVEWDGRDESGKPLSSGVYLYLLEAADWSDSKKMTLAR